MRTSWALAGMTVLLAGCAGAETAEPARFDRVPPSCGLISAGTATDLVGAASPRPGEGFTDSTGSRCEWTYEPPTVPSVSSAIPEPHRRTLQVTVSWYAQQGDISGVDLARQAFSMHRQDRGPGNTSAVEGVGEESMFASSNDRGAIVEFRRSNVIVTVDYEGNAITNTGSPTGLGEQRARDGAARAAREADSGLAGR
jgi:hypothetical protein